MIKKGKEFHFVINSKLKAKILQISKLLNLNLSDTILFILKNLSCLFNKIQFVYKKDCIEKANWDTHIHLRLNEGNKKIRRES